MRRASQRARRRGDVARLIPEIRDHLTAPLAIDDPQLARALERFHGRLVEAIQILHPRFFAEFGAEVRSGEHLRIEAALALFWTCAGALVLAGSVRDHPLRTPAGWRRALMLIAPQGWGFFTRDPREPVDRAYRRGREGWEEIAHANSSAQNTLGLSRGARAVGVELTAILGRVPAERWRDCRDPAGACWRVATPGGAPVRNPALRPRVCGDILVERRPPVPWAWSRSHSRLAMPARAVRVEVACIAASAPPLP